jgi:hypothetical protein
VEDNDQTEPEQKYKILIHNLILEEIPYSYDIGILYENIETV